MKANYPMENGKAPRAKREGGMRTRVVFELPFDPYIQNRASLARTKRNDFPVAGGVPKGGLTPPQPPIYLMNSSIELCNPLVYWASYGWLLKLGQVRSGQVCTSNAREPQCGVVYIFEVLAALETATKGKCMGKT